MAPRSVPDEGDKAAVGGYDGYNSGNDEIRLTTSTSFAPRGSSLWPKKSRLRAASASIIPCRLSMDGSNGEQQGSTKRFQFQN